MRPVAARSKIHYPTLLRRVGFALIAIFSIQAHAQNTPLQQALDYANTLTPQNAKQIANPSALPSGGNIPSQMPSGLGIFSNPNTAFDQFQKAKTSGLTFMGQEAQQACATHVQGTDPIKDEECRAINVLTTRCMSPSNSQQAILGSYGQSMGSAANCEGTYGSNVQKSNYLNLVSENDPMFSRTSKSAITTQIASDQTCTEQTVEITPAQYETQTCTQSQDTSVQTCSQYLNIDVISTFEQAKETLVCNEGVLENGYCVQRTSIPATTVYSCPPDKTLSGTSCTQTLTTSATPNYSCLAGETLQGAYCIGSNQTSRPASIASYTCPLGYSLNGSSCNQTTTTPANIVYSCQSGYTLNGSMCSITTTTSTATPTYSCPAGTALSGNQCVALANTCTPGALLSTSTAYQGPWLDPYVHSFTYCAAGGYNITTYSSASSTPGSPFQYYLSNKFIAATFGQSTAQTFLADLGDGCSYPIYYKATCSGNSCSVNTYYVQNNCNGSSWTASGTYNIPYVSTTATLTGYSCPAGSAVSGTSCITTATTSANISYTCPVEYTLSGSTCSKIITASATPNYSCSAGETLQGAYCIGTNQTSRPASIASYSCSPGYTLTNNTCTQILTTQASSTQTCPAGQTLSGNSCIKTVSTEATPLYSCPVGALLKGQTCISKSVQTSWTDTCTVYEKSAGKLLEAP